MIGKKCVSIALARATRKLVGFHMKWGLESWSPIDAGGLPLDLPLALSAVAHTPIPSQILLFNLDFMGWCNTPQRSLSPSGGWMRWRVSIYKWYSRRYMIEANRRYHIWLINWKASPTSTSEKDKTLSRSEPTTYGFERLRPTSTPLRPVVFFSSLR